MSCICHKEVLFFGADSKPIAVYTFNSAQTWFTRPKKSAILPGQKRPEGEEWVKSISVGNRLFLRRFCIFRAALKAYLTSLTPSTTTPCPGIPPANSQRTKQFFSHPHGLIYILYYFILLYMLYIYIYIYLSFWLQPWHDVEPPSLLLVAWEVIWVICDF